MKHPISFNVIVASSDPMGTVFIRTGDGMYFVFTDFNVRAVNSSAFDAVLREEDLDGSDSIDRLNFSNGYDGPPSPLAIGPNKQAMIYGRPSDNSSRIQIAGYYTDDPNQT